MLLQLVLAVVAVLSPACQAGLLRVPRVYNALISTNQRLSPSRADTVSLPAVPVLGPLAVVPALVAADKANATEPAAAAGNHTAAAVLPLAVYSPYYYHPYHYAYHYSSPFLLPPPPLLHPYSYGYLPLAFPVPAAPPGVDDKADDAPKEQPSDDDSKETVTVKDL